MAEVFSCGRPARRTQVLAQAVPAVNGIDYVEVITDPTPVRCEVRLLFPAPGQAGGVPAAPALGVANFRVEGGVRVTPVRVVAVTPGADPHVVVVEVDRQGDFSPYALVLVASADATAPPVGFDPRLASVELNFRLDCEQPSDCAPTAACAPTPRAAPVIDYLAKDYASFRRVMLERLAVLSPGDPSPADARVALVEAVAYTADRLSYLQDAVATEAYLGTARQRISVRRHARLLDYTMHEGANARAWVQVCVDGPGGAWLRRIGKDQRPVRLHTHADAPLSADAEAFDELWRSTANARPLVYEPLADTWVQGSHAEISFYTWDDEDCCLPAGATGAWLVDSTAERLRLRVGDVLVLGPQRVDPDTGAPSLRRDRHAVRLTRVVPEAVDPPGGGARTVGPMEVDPLHPSQGVVYVEWAEADALPTPLAVSRIDDDGVVHRLAVAHANLVLVDHGLTFGPTSPVHEERRGRVRLTLPEPDLTFAAPLVDTSASATLRTDPRAAVPALVLTADGEAWEARVDLLDSDLFDRHFVVEMDDRRLARLRFGDGTAGRAPAPGTTFTATYRVGNGAAGNVPEGAIARLAGVGDDITALGVTWVGNLLPAQGGVAPEPVEQVRDDAPVAFRTQLRAVTPADYVRLTETHPEVQKAAATLRWTGSWHTVFVTVDRLGGRPVDAAFEAEILAWLEPYRLAGGDIEVDAPLLVPLDLHFRVCVEDGYFRADVKRRLVERFGSGALPDGSQAWFHPDRRTFGEPVYLGPIVAEIMKVPGVHWVDTSVGGDPATRFQRWGRGDAGELAAGVITMGRLEIARCDSDPSAPEHGWIDFTMNGGL